MSIVLDDYLIMINGVELPNQYIRRRSYSAKLDPISAGKFQNANGATVEKYFPYRALNVNFSVSAQTEELFRTLIGYFTFDDGTKDVTVTAWVPDENAYITQKCTISGLQPLFEAYSTDYTAIYGDFKIKISGRGGAPA